MEKRIKNKEGKIMELINASHKTLFPLDKGLAATMYHLSVQIDQS